MPASSSRATLVCDCPKSRLSKLSYNQKPGSNRKGNTNKVISWIAGLSLVFAFVYGLFFNHLDYSEIIKTNLDTDQVSMISENEYEIVSNHEGMEKISQLILGEESGYGGPLVVGPLVSKEGSIEKILLVDNKETHSFIRKLRTYNFFKQFDGMHIANPLTVGEDIDAVNGATISCVAITNAVSKSAHMYGKQNFNLTYKVVAQKWKITMKDYFAAILLLIATVAVLSGKKWFRYTSLGISMIFLGFYFNSAVNVSHFGRVLLGFLPVFKLNIFWFILVFGSIGFAFLLKKNAYCNAMCPFHAVETIMVRIGGMKIKFTPGIQKIAKHSSKFLLWLTLMLIFISRNPTIAAFEPFAMVFGLEGEGIHWYLLPLVLTGVLLITDYFCRYFCPVGKGFNYIIKFRKWIDSQIIQIRSTTLKKIN